MIWYSRGTLAHPRLGAGRRTGRTGRGLAGHGRPAQGPPCCWCRGPDDQGRLHFWPRHPPCWPTWHWQDCYCHGYVTGLVFLPPCCFFLFFFFMAIWFSVPLFLFDCLEWNGILGGGIGHWIGMMTDPDHYRHGTVSGQGHTLHNACSQWGIQNCERGIRELKGRINKGGDA